MGSAALASSARAPEPWLATLLVAALGTGFVFIIAGVAMDDLPLAAAGGAALGAAITTLVATGWAGGLEIVAMSLPLPALYGTPELRIATALPVTAAVLAGWGLRLGVTARLPDLRLLPLRTCAALLGVIVLTTATAQSPMTSLREVANLLVLFAFLALAADQIANRPEQLRGALRVLVVIAALCGVLAVFEMLAILPGEFPRTGTRFFRAALGFGQPNALGLFLAMSVPLAAHEVGIARGVRRAAAVIALGAIVVGLISTFSRGAWLSILFGTGALLFMRGRGYVLRVWLIAAVAAVAADIATGGALRDTVQRTLDDWVIEQRAALMLVGVLMFLEHPLAGVGPGGYAASLERYGARIPELRDYLPTPHNAYIQMAAETGIFGLIAFIVFLAVALGAALRLARATAAGNDFEEASLRRALLWSLAIACLACFVLWPFSHGTGQAVMLVMAACFAAQRR